MKDTYAYILDFKEIDRSTFAEVGGKGANLGELSRIEGIRVPDGFCITTQTWQEIVKNHASFGQMLDQLATLNLNHKKEIGDISAKIRKLIEGMEIPNAIRDELSRRLDGMEPHESFAVRSSATAEDLPTASFAGQQDTYLNVIGKQEILKHISKCWASLFTERAVIYRIQNGFDHRKVFVSVVVQKMVFPQVSGILFTADPVTSNRKVLSIDAGFGLGEALVSGLVNADHYKVRDGKIVDKIIAVKKQAIYALKEGGTETKPIGPDRQEVQALSEEQILELERIGRTIESHFGCPQDIEWSLVDDRFYILQSRPITTLYPIPKADDDENRVYVSVGHNQMMTDAMKPLGLSVWLHTSMAPMRVAGGRLFVDVTRQLSSLAGRKTLIMDTIGKSDPLIKDALINISEREGFIKMSADAPQVPGVAADARHDSLWTFQSPIAPDPSIVSALMEKTWSSLATLKENIADKSGPELFDFVKEDFGELKKLMVDPQSFAVIMTAMTAPSWLNEKMNEWLNEKNAADAISQSVPDNMTSEMGLELLDLADVIRPYPEIVAYLKQVKEDIFLEELVRFPGGKNVRDAIKVYLDKYGMRCSGEIDVTRTRWSENPAALLPLILGNIKNFAPGEGKRKFTQGLQEALKKEQDLLDRLRQLPDGDLKAEETKKVIDLIRTFAGYREFPKYGIVSRYFIYKQALMKEAAQLVQAHVIDEKEDVHYLSFEEFHEAVRTHQLDRQLIEKRKEEYKVYEKLTPPRVITSEGEIISGTYKREDLPAGAIAGLPVSSGLIEGRARVILSMEDAGLEEGDILVTAFTDPSWTPLFVSIKGLVTEVGGLMTHGAVIAREYGLPAVVGVENATKLIKDGQRIRVNGADGYVELL